MHFHREVIAVDMVLGTGMEVELEQVEFAAAQRQTGVDRVRAVGHAMRVPDDLDTAHAVQRQARRRAGGRDGTGQIDRALLDPGGTNGRFLADMTPVLRSGFTSIAPVLCRGGAQTGSGNTGRHDKMFHREISPIDQWRTCGGVWISDEYDLRYLPIGFSYGSFRPLSPPWNRTSGRDSEVSV